jgi:serine/threonine protein kinase
MPDSTPFGPMPTDQTHSQPVNEVEQPDTVNPATPAEAAREPTSTRPDTDAVPPQTDPALTGYGRLGDYELLGELGQGGMGRVFKAKQVNVGRVVAIKLLLGGQWASPAEVRRFLLEARALGNLDHPNIVPIYDRGEHEGRHWFSMKYVEGGSLARRAQEFKSDPRRAAQFVATVARAVAHAHSKGILHRDLKPANILVDAAGQPHVTDFGLARWHQEGDSLTPTGSVLGTPGYMAPEQIVGGRAVTAAADVYGLGAVLYCLLTGRAPFSGSTPFETMRRVQEQLPEPPSAANPGLASSLESVCLRCLEKDPAARYPSAESVAEALEEWLSQSTAVPDIRQAHTYSPALPTATRAHLARTAINKRLLLSFVLWIVGTVLVIGSWTGKFSFEVGLVGGLVAAVASVVRYLPNRPPTAKPNSQSADAAARALQRLLFVAVYGLFFVTIGIVATFFTNSYLWLALCSVLMTVIMSPLLKRIVNKARVFVSPYFSPPQEKMTLHEYGQYFGRHVLIGVIAALVFVMLLILWSSREIKSWSP